jgi:hypothetical protein
MSEVNDLNKHSNIVSDIARKALYLNLDMKTFVDMENWRFKDESKVEFIKDAIRALIEKRSILLGIKDDE